MGKRNKTVLVEHLSDEISDLEDRVKIYKKANERYERIRKVKIFGNFLRLVLPYIACIGLAFGASYGIGGDIPFYPQDVLKVNHHVEEFDNRGNVNSESEFREAFADTDSSAAYYTKWELKADNRYYRFRKVYKFKSGEVSLGALRNAVANNTDLDSIIGNPFNSKMEIKDSLTEEDLANDGYMTVTYKYQDEKDFIVAPEETASNIGRGVIFILVSGLNMLVYSFFSDFSSYDYFKEKDEINKYYVPNDLSYLEKELAEKKLVYANRSEKEQLISNGK